MFRVEIHCFVASKITAKCPDVSLKTPVEIQCIHGLQKHFILETGLALAVTRASF